ncbi:hypothetical protein Plhal304r1_c015g0056121 [Plasmopara halstedii]
MMSEMNGLILSREKFLSKRSLPKRVTHISTCNLSFPSDDMSNDYHSSHNFRVSGDLNLHGRMFRIVDCYAFSRSFTLRRWASRWDLLKCI